MRANFTKLLLRSPARSGETFTAVSCASRFYFYSLAARLKFSREISPAATSGHGSTASAASSLAKFASQPWSLIFTAAVAILEFLKLEFPRNFRILLALGVGF